MLSISNLFGKKAAKTLGMCAIALSLPFLGATAVQAKSICDRPGITCKKSQFPGGGTNVQKVQEAGQPKEMKATEKGFKHCMWIIASRRAKKFTLFCPQ